MTCNCGSGDTPEYYITLDGVGVDGYSPEVNVVDDTSSSFKIEAVNKNNTQQTPAIPKLGYIQNTYVSNTSLASTLSAYSTTAQMNTALAGKLNVDGSNADSNITINNLPIKTYSGTGSRIGDGGNLSYLAVQSRDVRLQNYNSTGGLLASIQLTNGDINISTNGVAKYNGYELATVDQIPIVGNGTITFAQGGVTKGTFTTNQSGNTTINLDSGAKNPLMLNADGEAGTGYVEIKAGSTATDNQIVFGSNTGFGAVSRQLILLSDVADNITLTDNSFGTKKLSVDTMVGCDSITAGAAGLVPAPSAGDENKFLKADGTWDTVGGGGSSYTEGRGIDITNDTISVDESVVMTTSNQSTINFGAKQFSHITIANGYSTGEGLYGWLDDGSSTIPLVRVSDLDDVIIGDGGSKLVLHGDETRPSYFNGQTTSYLALYSDIPDVSSFVTTSTLSTTLADYVLSSSLATVATTGSYADLLNKPTIPTNSDYVDLTSNQTVGGNKTFTGTNYLRNTYICNASGTYFGRMRAVDNKFTFEGIGTNRSINFIPDGTGELQYNGIKVATVNDIPDVSQLQEKLTAGSGIKLSKGINIPLEQTLPYTFNSTRANTNFVSSANFDTTKERVVILEVPIDVAYVTFYLNGVDARYGIVVKNTGLSDIYVSDGSYSSQYNTTSFPVSGSHNYLKFVIDTDNKTDIYYGYDNSTWNLLLSKERSNQNADTWTNGVNICNDDTTGWTLDYLEAFYPLANSELISCDDTIQRKLTPTGGIKIEPNGSVRVNPLIALPYTASESSTDKIFNASDTTVDGTEICGKWGSNSVIVFSNNSTALESGYGFYWNDYAIIAMARLNGQYNGLTTINNISYEDYFYYKIKFFEDGTVDMYYSTDGITYNLAISTTTAVGGDLYGQDIYVCGGNSNVLQEAHLEIPSTNPVISLDPTTIQGYNSTGTLYLKLVDGVLQWTA